MEVVALLISQEEFILVRFNSPEEKKSLKEMDKYLQEWDKHQFVYKENKELYRYYFKGTDFHLITRSFYRVFSEDFHFPHLLCFKKVEYGSHDFVIGILTKKIKAFSTLGYLYILSGSECFDRCEIYIGKDKFKWYSYHRLLKSCKFLTQNSTIFHKIFLAITLFLPKIVSSEIKNVIHSFTFERKEIYDEWIPQ